MYTIKKVANGNTGLFYNNTFCGLLGANSITNFSGHNDQIFDVEICAEYLLKTNDKVYSTIKNAGNQMYLEVRLSPYKLAEGIWKEHIKSPKKD